MSEELMREHFERWYKTEYYNYDHHFQLNDRGAYVILDVYKLFIGFKAGVELASTW